MMREKRYSGTWGRRDGFQVDTFIFQQNGEVIYHNFAGSVIGWWNADTNGHLNLRLPVGHGYATNIAVRYNAKKNWMEWDDDGVQSVSYKSSETPSDMLRKFRSKFKNVNPTTIRMTNTNRFTNISELMNKIQHLETSGKEWRVRAIVDDELKRVDICGFGEKELMMNIPAAEYENGSKNDLPSLVRNYPTLFEMPHFEGNMPLPKRRNPMPILDKARKLCEKSGGSAEILFIKETDLGFYYYAVTALNCSIPITLGEQLLSQVRILEFPISMEVEFNPRPE